MMDNERIAESFIETKLTFSMLSTAIYSLLLTALAIQPFTNIASDVIGVGGAMAQICKYVFAPVELDCTAVYYTLAPPHFNLMLIIGARCLTFPVLP